MNDAVLQGHVLSGHGVIAMTGADARDVLQGVVTADVDALSPGKALYAALLTPQGKYLFDFFLLEGEGGRVLIDIAASRARDFAQRMSMYCLRRDAKVISGPPWQVAQVWGGNVSGGDLGALAMAVPDPRVEALGSRIYAEDIGTVLAEMGAEEVGADAYAALRIAHAVPETGVELVPDQTFILEAGFERLGGVDFRKGCYVGQEVTARMKHKTELRKGLVKVRVAGTAAPGTEIKAGGKPAGVLFSTEGTTGLAHLRLDRAGAGMTAGEATVDYEDG